MQRKALKAERYHAGAHRRRGVRILSYGLLVVMACGSCHADSPSSVTVNITPAAAVTVERANLIPLNFEGIQIGDPPPGFSFRGGSGNGVRMEVPDNSPPVIRVEMVEKDTFWLDFKSVIHLEQGRKYMFSVLVKTQDLSLDGSHVKRGGWRGVMIYVYSAAGTRHAWALIAGHGDTDGWVNVLLPFDTAATPELADAKIYLRGYDLSGTIWFKDPVLFELPEGFDLAPHMVLPDGRCTPTGIFILNP